MMPQAAIADDAVPLDRLEDDGAPPALRFVGPRFLCTCGWILDVVRDLDAESSYVRCGNCGGVAVRVTRALTP